MLTNLKNSDGDGAARIEALRLGGVARYAVGDMQAAASLWRQALDLDPDDIQAQAYVAWIESRLRGDHRGPRALPADSLVPASVFTADTIDPIAVIADELELDSEKCTHTGSSPTGVEEPGQPADEFDDVEARVKRFLADTPTLRNLAPLMDAPILDEERLPELAGWLQPAPPAPLSDEDAALDVEIEVAPGEPMAAGGDPDGFPRRIAAGPPAHETPSQSAFPLSLRVLAARRAFDRAHLNEAVAIAEEVVASAGPDAPSIAHHVATLSMIFERVLGRRDRLVRIGSLPPQLEARSAFLLSRVDGSFSIDDLLDISGMERFEAVRRVALLLRCGALVPV